MNASIAAAMKKAAPTAIPEAPKLSIRSGISTSKAPERTDGRTTSQNANSTGAPMIAAATRRTLGTPLGLIAGVASTHAASTAAITPTAQKTTSGPVTVAIPPITGPSRIPKIAAASAAPIISPRRSSGAAASSQASPPVQAQAPPTPSAKRARSRTTISVAKAKTTLEVPRRKSPTSIVERNPIRAARKPDGSAAIRVPAA